MSESHVTKAGWEDLINGNLDWLQRQPESLEKWHIRVCLNYLMNNPPSAEDHEVTNNEVTT